LAHASREAARADALSTGKHLKEVQKATEVLHVQEAVAVARLRDADHRIGMIRAALDELSISEISLSDGEDDVESGGDGQCIYNEPPREL
jgi:hypothetical protein